MQLKTVATIVAITVAGTLPMSGEQRVYAEFASVAKSTGVRLTPDLARTPLAMLREGTMVKVVKREGDWVSVQFNDGLFGYRAGYILASDLTFGKSPAPVTQPAGNTAQPDVPSDELPLDPGVKFRARPETVIVYASLNEQDIALAVDLGRKAKGRTQGLVVTDAAVGPGQAATSDRGMRVEVFTTLAWVRQLASEASTENRPYTVHDVNAETLEPVLRVVAYPEMPDTATGTGMPETASIRHVVLRDESSRIVFQPVFTEQFEDNMANTPGEGDKAQALRAKFHLDAIYELCGPRRDRDFFVTVIDSRGVEKSFRIEKKRFVDPPQVR